MCSRFLFLILFCHAISGQIYKLCSTPADRNACYQISSDGQASCSEHDNGVNCLLSINSEHSDIGTISPEEAFLGANLADNVIVIGEIINTEYPAYQTAVVVKKGINNITALRGKKFCHPGFKNDEQISYLVLEELGLSAVNTSDNICAKHNSSVAEKYIKSLSEFFGDSCRPGPWVQDEGMDETLKKKYQSLCKLCGDLGCNVDYKSPLLDSLDCLTEKNADVALTTVTDAQNFFSNVNNSANFQYLCKNGSSSPADKPCAWTTQLNSLIVSHRNRSAEAKNYLASNLNNQNLKQILKSEQYGQLAVAKDFTTLKQYVNERRPVPTLENKLCTTLKWCTNSLLENEKCKWLSQAALNRGIYPGIQCMQSKDVDGIGCINDVQNGSADFTVASTDYAYITFKKKLKALAYPRTPVSTIVVIKRADDNTSNSVIDLKGKGACLPRYGGKEFLAFVNAIRKAENLKKSGSDYSKIFDNFVGISCTPGLLSTDIQEATNDVDKEKLCGLCVPANAFSTATICNDDSKNKYHGYSGSLECLSNKAGDFAVIALPQDRHNLEKFDVICENNKTVNAAKEIEADCALTTIPNFEIVARNNYEQNLDIVYVLNELDRWFGENPMSLFNMFGEFNGTKNVIFENTTNLEFNYDNNEFVNNYKNLLKDAQESSMSGSVTISSTGIFVTVVMLAQILFY